MLPILSDEVVNGKRKIFLGMIERGETPRLRQPPSIFLGVGVGSFLLLRFGHPVVKNVFKVVVKLRI